MQPTLMDVKSKAPIAHLPELVNSELLLRVRDLKLQLGDPSRPVRAIDGLNLDLHRGRTLCIVGESGCGKSMTARALMRLAGPPGRLVSGEMLFKPSRGKGEMVDLAKLEPNGPSMRAIRGRDIAMIFQEPMTSLSPVHTVGDQITEAIRIHNRVSMNEARGRAIELLTQVGIPKAADRLDNYTFQLSGGMRQRVMIAMALSCSPSLLIADEPTTALDVTTQAQILDLLRNLRERMGMAMIFITHDLGVVAEMADEVAVMYLGKVVEHGPVADVLLNPQHPYTQALLRSRPAHSVSGQRLATISGMVPDPLNRPAGCAFHNRCDHFMPGICDVAEPPAFNRGGTHSASCFLLSSLAPGAALPVVSPSAAPAAAVAHGEDVAPGSSVLEVRDLKVHFPIRRGWLRREVGAVRAVDGVDLVIRRGETLGLVGESGCGKTTIGRSIVRAIAPTSGSIRLLPGTDREIELVGRSDRQLKQAWRDVRFVFQDPHSSLDPRLSVLDIVGEPLQVGRIARGRELEERVAVLLTKVGLRPEYMRRYAHEFSGGERQRISIARALALEPEILVCDEAVSALDVSVQAQILNLLQDLKSEFGLTLLFISHDLSVIRHICDRVAVAYLGRIVELAPSNQLFERPLHPYAEALISAIPSRISRDADHKRTSRIVLRGETPDPANPPAGCPFHDRCAYADGSRCSSERPPLVEITPGRSAACHYATELSLRGAEALATA